MLRRNHNHSKNANNNVTITIRFDKQRGVNETCPVIAGKTVKGIVMVELKRPIKLQHNIFALTNNNNNNNDAKEAATNNNNSNKDNNELVLLLRINGKEKVQMRKPKHAKHWAKLNGSEITNNNTNPKTKYPKYMEHEFLNLMKTLQEEDYPLSAFHRCHHNNNTIEQGIYVFPFCIPIPCDIPSTTSWNPVTGKEHVPLNQIRYGLKSKPGVRIQYKVSVRICHSNSIRMDANDLPKLQQPNDYLYCHDQLLWVQSRSSNSVFIANAIHSCSQCCSCTGFCHGGSATATTTNHHAIPAPIITTVSTDIFAAARFSDSHCGTTSTTNDCNNSNRITLNLACRNNTRSKIQRVQVQLVEVLRWGTNGMMSRPSTTTKIARVTAPNNTIIPVVSISQPPQPPQEGTKIALLTLQDVPLPSLGKNPIGILRSMIRFCVPDAKGRGEYEQKCIQDVCHMLTTDPNSTLQISLPQELFDKTDSNHPSIRTSYRGKLVTVEHQIEIQFITKKSKKYLSKNRLDPNTIVISINVLPMPSDDLVQPPATKVSASTFTPNDQRYHYRASTAEDVTTDETTATDDLEENEDEIYLSSPINPAVDDTFLEQRSSSSSNSYRNNRDSPNEIVLMDDANEVPMVPATIIGGDSTNHNDDDNRNEYHRSGDLVISSSTTTTSSSTATTSAAATENVPPSPIITINEGDVTVLRPLTDLVPIQPPAALGMH